jgi:cytidylate kinase
VVVLRGHPNVLSVRLDGPVEERIQRAMLERSIDEATARREQRETDEARETYMRTFYGQSLGNLELYEVMLDSTALSQETCTEIILRAASEPLLRRSPSSEQS